MKITPDYKDRNDEYDDDTIRFYESLDDKGYFYEMYVLIDGQKAAIIVTDCGVSIDFISGHSIHTNIVPKRIFGERKDLNWNRLYHIIKILENTGLEGRNYSPKEMKDLYQKWKDLGEP